MILKADRSHIKYLLINKETRDNVHTKYKDSNDKYTSMSKN